jgi:hypothetical protein
MTRATTKATTTKKAAAAKTSASWQEEAEHMPVDARQLQRLHGLLHGHGIDGDVTRHDWLSARLSRPITTASEVTKVEAAQIIAELEAEDAPEVHTLTSRALRKLRAPFSDAEVGKLPRALCRACSDNKVGRDKGTCPDHPQKAECRICGNYHNTRATMHIDFVGHADVTARLLDVDPTWTWEPMATDPNGFPILDQNGGLWINLTVCGVTRPGYGEGSSGQQKGGDTIKVAIGDALRNAAMRFGVALDLWAKGDREWSKAEKHGAEDMAPDQPPPAQDLPQEPYVGPTADQSVARLIELAAQQGTTLDGITAKWREFHGGLIVDDLPGQNPRDLDHLVQSIEAYIAQQATEAAAVTG